MRSWLCYFSAQKSQNVPQYRPREILALPLPLKTLMLWSQTPFQAHLPPCPLHILCFRQTRQLLGPRHSTGFPGFLRYLANSTAHPRGYLPVEAPLHALPPFSPQYKKYPFSLPFSPQIQKISFPSLGSQNIVFVHGTLSLELLLPYLITPENRDGVSIISVFLLLDTVLDK